MVSKALGRIEEGIISLLLVAMILLVFVDVLIRFSANTLREMGFDPAVIWMQELTLTTSAWMVLFGASYGVKVGSHIGVDALVRLFSPPVRRVISLFAVAACLAYCTLFLMASWAYVHHAYVSWSVMEDVRIPIAIAKHIPLGLAEVLHLDLESLLLGIENNAPPEYLEAPQFPHWIALSMLLFGMGLLALRFLQLGYALIIGEADGFHMADEAEEALEHFGEHDEEATPGSDADAASTKDTPKDSAP